MYVCLFKAQFRPKIHLATACNETVLERRRGGVNGSLQGVARSCKESPEKMADFWSEEREENLIQLLEDQPVLYDVGRYPRLPALYADWRRQPVSASVVPNCGSIFSAF